MAGGADEPREASPPKNRQQQLLDALLEGDFQEFRQILSHPSVDPSFKYGKPHFSTCLEIACRLRDRHPFVHELLTKVKPNINRILPEPIHYAAGRGNADALELLLKDKRTKVNAQDSAGRTALHHAARNFSSGEESVYYERCVSLLLAHPDVDANRPNNKGYTPIHEAAIAAGKHAVQAFIRHTKQDIDFDRARGHGRTARWTILAKYPELKDALPECPDAIVYDGRCDPQSRLVVELLKRDLDAFCQLLVKVDTEGCALADPNYWYGKPIKSTCLEIACKEPDYENFMEPLLRAGADPNIVNPITEKSPIHIAAENANFAALRVLLAYKTNVNVTDSNGRTALHYVVSTTGDVKEDEECVLKLLNEPSIDINIKDNNGITPILSAALAGNKASMKIMLQLKSEYLDLHSSKLPDKKNAWEVIAERYPELKNILPDYSHHVQIQPPSIVLQLSQHLHKRQTKDFIERIKEQNNESQNNYVNGDDGTSSFLQYSCKHGLSDVVEFLLKYGADPNKTLDTNKWPPIVIVCNRQHHNILLQFLNLPTNRKLKINATDTKGNTALHYAAKHGNLNSVLALLTHGANIKIKNIFDKPPLPAKAVNNLLDQCLKADEKHYPEEDDYEVWFDYEILVPHKIERNEIEEIKTEDIPLKNVQGENYEESVKYEKPEHITWTINAEMDFLFYLSRSHEHTHLLNHPLITSFLNLKWHKVRLFYFINLIFFIFFLIFVNVFVLVEITDMDNFNHTDHDIIRNFTNDDISIQTLSLAIVLTLLLVYLMLRELMQLMMNPTQYIRNAENILDWGLIASTIVTLYININNKECRKTVTVLTILCSWMELVLITGRLPIFSSNFQMLKTVAWTFLRFLGWYSLLIISFGISFFTMFHDAKNSEKNNEKNSFRGLGSSLFKTFIMMTGEFNSDDKIPFASTNFTSYIIFILFVFVIAIVLLNLLTGLAVSDTQRIKNNAQLLSLISRIRLVYEIESVLLGWYMKFKSLRLLRPLTVYFEEWVKKTALFPPSVRVKHVCVQPNKGRCIVTPDNNGVIRKMDLDTLGAAMNIIGSRNKATDTDLIKTRLDIIEKCQTTNKQVLDVILSKLEEMQVK